MDDRQLMLSHDGEAPLPAEPTAEERRKLAAMAAIGDWLRGSAEAADPRADGIADAVMAAIAKAPLPALPREQPSEPDPEPKVVVPLVGRTGGNPRAANDNARRIFALAGLAAAAAAALFVWGKGQPAEVARLAPVAPPPVAAELAPEAPTRAKKAPERAMDAERGAEVASVDFGALQGSVFYVSGDDDANGGTPVVWVNDGDADR